MTTEDFIIHLLCLVDDTIEKRSKHPQAHLYPSEVVTIGLLFALKGGYFRAFYHWLERDYAGLFAGLPERTRLQRLLRTHQDWGQCFLATSTFFTVIDSYGIELIHPIREGRSPQQIGKKGKSNWRGMKLCWLLNDKGEVVSWDWDTANVHDQTFLHLLEQWQEQSLVLADTGLNDADGIPSNLKLCARGTWNEGMLVETALSLMTTVCALKKSFIVLVNTFKLAWLMSSPCLMLYSDLIVLFVPLPTLKLSLSFGSICLMNYHQWLLEARYF